MTNFEPIVKQIFEAKKKGDAVIEVYSQDDMLSAEIDIKGFLKDMSKTLTNLKFKDNLTNGGNAAKRGEMVENSKKKNFNRTGNMYETKYRWLNLPNGRYEFELKWEASGKVPHAKAKDTDIKVVFKMDLQARAIEKKEKLVDGKKIKTYSANWEFRNKVTYQNLIGINFGQKLTFLPEAWRFVYFARLYAAEIEEQIIFVDAKVVGAIYATINKHFAS